MQEVPNRLISSAPFISIKECVYECASMRLEPYKPPLTSLNPCMAGSDTWKEAAWEKSTSLRSFLKSPFLFLLLPFITQANACQGHRGRRSTFSSKKKPYGKWFWVERGSSVSFGGPLSHSVSYLIFFSALEEVFFCALHALALRGAFDHVPPRST